MSKEHYLSEVEKRLNRLFLASKDGYKASLVDKHRLEGFMHAGVIMGVVSKAELSDLMDEIHIQVFGKTIQQRKLERAAQWDDEIIDYSGYDQPTFERKEQ